jgi:glycosyltransferase involved in cell wall biosynthesis
MSRISVVIPLYNKKPYILRTIESVQRQTVGDFDLVVVDDGSQDGGDLIVEQIDDPRLTLVRRLNGGQSAARNTGIAHAKSDLIAFLDADDTWQPQFLEAMIDLRLTFPHAGVYACGYRVYNHGHLYCDISVDTAQSGTNQILIPNYFRMARVANFVWVSAVAVPRQVFSDVGNFLEGEHRAVDREMWARIALHYPIAYDSRLLANYRADAQGRENPRKDRKLQPPPFARTLKQAKQAGQVPADLIAELDEYMASMWLDYITKCGNNRGEIIRVLEQEMGSTQIYKREVFCLKLGARLLPLRLFHGLRRLGKSRWLGVRRLERQELGVVTRFHRSVEEPSRVEILAL